VYVRRGESSSTAVHSGRHRDRRPRDRSDRRRVAAVDRTDEPAGVVAGVRDDGRESGGRLAHVRGVGRRERLDLDGRDRPRERVAGVESPLAAGPREPDRPGLGRRRDRERDVTRRVAGVVDRLTERVEVGEVRSVAELRLRRVRLAADRERELLACGRGLGLRGVDGHEDVPRRRLADHVEGVGGRQRHQGGHHTSPVDGDRRRRRGRGRRPVGHASRLGGTPVVRSGTAGDPEQAGRRDREQAASVHGRAIRNCR
jgi:hypothetical protein